MNLAGWAVSASEIHQKGARNRKDLQKKINIQTFSNTHT